MGVVVRGASDLPSASFVERGAPAFDGVGSRTVIVVVGDLQRAAQGLLRVGTPPLSGVVHTSYAPLDDR